MTDIIAIANQKGGVGKSTTAAAVAMGLFIRGYKVLLIDLDAQSNLSYNFNAHNKALTALEVLTQTATATEAMHHIAEGLDLIPASPSLAGAEAIIKEIGKEHRLKEAIEPIQRNYDFIILDTPPSLGLVTVNAFTACNNIIIPIQADIYSLQGVGQLYRTIKAVKRYCNPMLYIRGILITRYNARTLLTRKLTELLQDDAKQLHTQLYETTIRECIAIKEAQALQQDIYTYNSNSNAAKDYNSFINEMLGL